MEQARAELTRVRSGLAVFTSARHAAAAVTLQLGAWALQWASCYLLFVALGLDDRADFGAAAGVLFAVNVTAVLPLTPSNLGVFQAAVRRRAHRRLRRRHRLTRWATGIILQAVEVATAVIMGAPALVKEGVSWREVRLRAMHSAPVALPPRGSRRAFETD
jgi:phosphatidylinositol alpha-mannosyltransferase